MRILAFESSCDETAASVVEMKDGKLTVIMDPRAKSVCPISRELDIDELAPGFEKRVRKAFLPLMKNAEFRAFMKAYSEYLDEFGKFF